MQQHSSSSQVVAPSSNGVLIVWVILLMGFIWLLLLPLHTIRPSMLPQDVENISGAERLALADLEKQSLVDQPLQIAALTNLGILAQSDHALGNVDRLFSLAAGRSARDFTAQSYLIDGLIARGNFPEAVYRMDGLLRAQVPQRAQVLATLSALNENRDGMKAIITELESNPPWRQAFFEFVGADVSNSDRLYSLFASMRQSHVEIFDSELRSYLRILINSNNLAKARFVWLDLLSEKQLRKLKLIYDGEFSAQSQNLYFDWTAPGALGVRVDRVMRPGGRDDFALMIDFESAKLGANIVEQIIQLPEGNYSLALEVDAKNLTIGNELEWQVRCFDKTAPLAALTSAVGKSGWAALETQFTVPLEDCSFQKLVLRPARSITAQKPFLGQIYFDKIRVTRKP